MKRMLGIISVFLLFPISCLVRYVAPYPSTWPSQTELNISGRYNNFGVIDPYSSSMQLKPIELTYFLFYGEVVDAQEVPIIQEGRRIKVAAINNGNNVRQDAFFEDGGVVLKGIDRSDQPEKTWASSRLIKASDGSLVLERTLKSVAFGQVVGAGYEVRYYWYEIIDK